MSKVITFSKVFPSYHPRAGEPTHFIEKIVSGLVSRDVEGCGTELIKSLRDSKLLSISVLNELYKGTYSNFKHHTIRAGHRWKVGDKFSPRVWSDKPYRSKQIQFAPEIEVRKTWDFSFLSTGVYRIGIRQFDGEVESHHELLELIAQNDGLSKIDFLKWFKYPHVFYGQIICWNNQINY